MSIAASAQHVLLRLRRQRFRARLALTCRLARADVRVVVAPTAEIGRGIRVRVGHGVRGALHVGANSRLGDSVEIRLSGGELHLGDWVEVRRGAALMVGGRLHIDGPNLISWGTVIHCDEDVHLAPHVVASEHVTITDSVHEHIEGAWHLDTVRTAPVAIGDDTWIGAKATITPGVRVGARCVVGAGAVVTRSVPDDHVATGVPARTRPRVAQSSVSSPTDP